ncbi:MAG: histidinol-phosphate transaminase [Cytophagaceae bacterium]|nr:histidinol-phosphate transaminase [Cytophagaceae bacterium]
MFSLQSILRENIKNIKPYSSARDEYKGNEGVFLDANENPFGSVGGNSYNRYPDPLQHAVKEKLSTIKGVSASQIFLGNGSDEAIDLLFRAVCRPGKDNVITMPPTYGMYEVSANINDTEIREIPLTENFEIDTNSVLQAIDEKTKIIFICSPNNPTGNCMNRDAILKILQNFKGLVVVDEAYIDFAPEKTLATSVKIFSNLVVLQTFSKAWGMAALRLGMAFADAEIIKVLNKIKPPYNINIVTQEHALKALAQVQEKDKMVESILAERAVLADGLKKLPSVLHVFPSDANFILVTFKGGRKAYEHMISKKIITRDRSKVLLCEDSIRITVGTSEENKALLQSLENYSG